MDRESFFIDVVGIPSHLAPALARVATQRSLARGEAFIRAGEPLAHIGFLISGSLRTFTLEAEGREQTDCLQVVPGSIIATTPDFGLPSPGTVAALTDTELYVVDAALIQQLVETDPAAEAFYTACLHGVWEESRAFRHVIRNMDANNRFRWFSEEYPEIVGSVPDHYIASFLGISPVTLSRVRAAMRAIEQA